MDEIRKLSRKDVLELQRVIKSKKIEDMLVVADLDPEVVFDLENDNIEKYIEK